MERAQELLHHLWLDYTASTPQAERIHALLSARGDMIGNDHVALRSLGDFGKTKGVGIVELAKPFEACGWQAQDSYAFTEKHLVARYWKHPDESLPKIFISELIVGALSAHAQAIIAKLLAQLPAGFGTRADIAWAGRPWQVAHADYQALLAESEYAAWVAAFGFRVNHFTVDVNRLTSFSGIAELNQFLLSKGFWLNEVGGLVKGSPAERLEQSSTRADAVPVEFSDGVFAIPSCYYEFARRYTLPTGQLFQGFVPASADKLFESTNVRS